jgi:hypothetical protein
MLSRQKRAVIESYNRGYRVTEEGDVISPTQVKRKLAVNCSSSRLMFTLKLKCKSVLVPVHQLVALQKYGKEAFLTAECVRHLNGNHLDNSLANIAIGTHSDNMMDVPKETRLRSGRIANKAAVKKLRKLTDEQVKELRQLRDNGWNYKELCNKFKLAKSTVSFVVNNKTYK